MYERNVGLRKRRSEPLLPSTEHQKGKLKLTIKKLNKNIEYHKVNIT